MRIDQKRPLIGYSNSNMTSDWPLRYHRYQHFIVGHGKWTKFGYCPLVTETEAIEEAIGDTGQGLIIPETRRDLDPV